MANVKLELQRIHDKIYDLVTPLADAVRSLQRAPEPAPFHPLIGEEGQVPFPGGQNTVANTASLERLSSDPEPAINAPRMYLNKARPLSPEELEQAELRAEIQPGQSISTPEQAAAAIAAMRAKSIAGPAVQQSTVPPVSESMPGPERYTQSEAIDYTKDRKGSKVFIFSPNGIGNTAEEFGDVIQRYNTSGGTDIAKGWAVVPPGKIANARMAFNSARDKLQKYAQESGSAIGRGVAAPLALGARFNEAVGISEEGAGQRVSNIGAKAGSAIGSFAASPLDNPESAASALATFLASKGIPLPAILARYAPGIVKNGTNNLSTAPGMIKTGAAAAMGYVAGGLGMGSEVDLKGALKEGLIGALSGGAPAVFLSALGKLPSQRAKQQILDDISGELKKTYGRISNDPQSMNAMLDTKGGLSTAVQKGVKGIIGDFEETGGKLLDSILEVTKGNLATGPQRTVTNRVKEMGKLATAMVEATGDPVRWREIKETYDIAKKELIDTVKGALPVVGNGVDKVRQAMETTAYNNRLTQQVTSAVNEFDSTLHSYRPALELFDILKKAGVDKQIIIREIQQELQGISHAGSKLVENVGDIAGRGADLTQRIDKRYNIGIPEAWLKVLGINLPGLAKSLDKVRMPLGEGYVGKVTGTMPGTSAAVTSVTQQAIRSSNESIKSFLEKDNK